MLPEAQIRPELSDEELPDEDVFLVECLAWGLLRAYEVEGPPVPVREMIKQALPVFERLELLELSLGLYSATYRTCLDGSRLIAVDLEAAHTDRRASMARELFVAFCRSSRAAELGWPCCERPHVYKELFARRLLIPASWLQQACTEDVSVEGLAARFGVPISMMSRRMNEVFRPPPRPDRGETLAQIMFSLEEPWLSRFLELMAKVAANREPKRSRPTQQQVANWLDASPALYQDVRYLLSTWRRRWNIWLTTRLTAEFDCP